MPRQEEWYKLSTYTVTTLADSGPGSLRQAILEANSSAGPDLIRFRVTGEILLKSALPTIEDHLTIDGPGAGSLTINGNGTQILNIGSAWRCSSRGSPCGGARPSRAGPCSL